MSWIKEISYEEAGNRLKKLYDRIKGPGHAIDNIMQVHSLRPHTMKGHLALYKNVLHNRNNTLPKWYLETVGLYVSLLNKCDYCIDHHFAGLKRLLDDGKAKKIKKSLDKQDNSVLDEKEQRGLAYARKLTLNPGKIKQNDIQMLKKAGFSDGEILELNQVASYFSYANRTVLGLGVTTGEEVLGLSPGDYNDPDNWSHQ